MPIGRRRRTRRAAAGGAVPAAPTLTAPASVTDDTAPTFTWGAVTFAVTYDLQVATDSGFAALVIDETAIAATSHTPVAALTYATTYYARVRGVNASSVAGAWSDTLTFICEYYQQVKNVGTADLIGYYVEPQTGVDFSALDNDGTATAVTAGDGIGDGHQAGVFDGATSKLAINAIAGEFNGAEGTISIYGKVSAAGVWTDATGRRLINLLADNSNRIYINKSSTSNVVECTYIAGGTAEAVNIPLSTTDWFQITITWSLSNDRFRAYLNGVQSGTDQATLGTWAGTLSATESLVGARATNANVFSGSLAHAAIWDRELTPTEVGQLPFFSVTGLPLGFSDDKIRMVWATDTHVQPLSVPTVVNFEAAIADTNDWKPNAFMVSGDFGNNNNETMREAWTHLRAFCKRPYYVAIGNHDENEFGFDFGNTNYLTLEGSTYWNMPARFDRSAQLVSGDGTLKALLLLLDCNIYDDDPGGITNSIHHEPGDRTGISSYALGNGWWRRFGAEGLAFVTNALAADTDSDIILFVAHFPPEGATFTDWTALADVLQADGRPACGFSGHVHPAAYPLTITSTDEAATFNVYKAPAMLESGCWTRVTLSLSAGAIVIDEMEIQHFTDPGGWTISAPFSLPA